jgi:hypothetical protein
MSYFARCNPYSAIHSCYSSANWVVRVLAVRSRRSVWMWHALSMIYSLCSESQNHAKAIIVFVRFLFHVWYCCSSGRCYLSAPRCGGGHTVGLRMAQRRLRRCGNRINLGSRHPLLQQGSKAIQVQTLGRLDRRCRRSRHHRGGRGLQSEGAGRSDRQIFSGDRGYHHH